ncbi:MAG: Unknown protein [uncultured Thiotrichaceae bacterium]|uniref:Acyltransferase 3 domain-containing protein n=1 Tax=uncultured Thiotrichaceae bacterium TaxID=298394 RepID=A0A6S6TSF5_9GAMM|nr:MAG: Unknown protein [uncultured Thiotrichaceae bacterium]
MHLNQITFTRFLAALTVVFFHYGSEVFPANIPFFGQAFQAGPIAVNYFYLLSGFIMAIAYFSADQSKTLNKKRYWIARFARIYPVYLLALLLVAAGKFKDPGFTTDLLLNLSLLQAWIPGYPLSLNSPGWSLSVEAFFYAAFPFILIFIQRIGLKKVTLLALLLWFTTQLIHTYWLNSTAYQAKNLVHDAIYYHPLMHINAFILGVVVGAYFKQNSQKIETTFGQYSNVILFVSSAILILLLAQPQPAKIAILNLDIALTNGLIGPLFLLFIVALAINKGVIAKTLNLPILILLGEASYSLYILQRPVYGIYDRTIGKYLAIPEAAHFYLYLVVLIAISIASYKLFETPLREYIKKIAK